MMRQLIGSLVAGIGVVVLVGCSGGSAVEAKGTLTWEDGKPVSGANLRLVPKEVGKQEVVGSTGKDGEFTLSTLGGKAGAPRGEYTVVVSPGTGTTDMPAPTGQMSQEEMAKLMQSFKNKQKAQPKSDIPIIYSDPGKTPLTLTISGAKSDHVLKLKKS